MQRLGGEKALPGHGVREPAAERGFVNDAGVKLVLRHLVAVAALPFTATVLVPLWLARRNVTHLDAGESVPEIAGQITGVVLLVAGGLLFIACLRRFVTERRGTLAPWDPPRRLVVRGPYRYVRNPMISAVVLVLFGEALILRSVPHLVWALVFLGVNAVYIPLVEEPLLLDRFGAEYRDYRRHVPRLVPRLRPWRRS
jgi:protein-S-isoprenylcysteine O-methyltransferase Ste14